MQTVIETPAYLRDAKAASLTERECQQVVAYMAGHPAAGDEIPGTGGARKVRFAGRGKGKSSGYRVITFYAGPDLPVFLLNVFAKGDKVNLTQAERNALKQILSAIVTAYREGVRTYVERRNPHP